MPSVAPIAVVRSWIDAFNKADAAALANLYAPDAVNDQVVFAAALTGRAAIRKMFELEFSRATMVCIEERIYECGDTAILQWRDPLGLRGCGFFQIRDNQIVHQQGYFDQVTFFRLQGLPLPGNYLDDNPPPARPQAAEEASRWTREPFTVSCDRDDQDFTVIGNFLRSSYWAQGIPENVVKSSVENSLCFALLNADDEQIGFARVVTDYATFAYLGDVFVLGEYRGAGLGTWLMECVRAHPRLRGLRRWMLATRDAHGLYRKLGFSRLHEPDRFMEIHRPYVPE